jgi:hypothetical protein
MADSRQNEIGAPTMSETTLRPLELHYFRIPRERWELLLARARQMGADAISTLVPWSWHEPGKGTFDLTGISHPARDVTDFLDTCQVMGFRVTLGVAPYVRAGLLGGGVPGWLPGDHPEICALDPNSQPRRDPTSGSAVPCAEHPTFLKYLERWYRELSGVLAGWSWPDGPVVALRVDHPGPDESEPLAEGIPAHRPNHWDFNPHVIEVQWPVWLRQGYDGIDALNTAWGTDYRSFSDAEFPRQFEAPGLTQQLEDATRFVAHASDHARETYVRLLREGGWRVPILSDRDAPPVTHVAQVDPDPPGVGTGVRWAMDAPLRADGWPRRRFWAVKAATLEMEAGVKAVEGGTLVAAAESGRFRLPRPAGDYGVYRLLLSGEMVEAHGRKRGDALLLDYVAADEIGETDMVVILDDPSAPLTGTLREYLVSPLMGRVSVLRRAGAMCQALAESLSASPPPPGREAAPSSQPASQDLAAAEQGLAQAHRAAHRAAASVGRLERLAGEVRGDLALSVPALPDATAFSAGELERLSPARDACAQVAPMLTEAAGAVQAACQPGESETRELTLQAYQAVLEEARAATREAETTLTDALARLRADLASGALPPVAWTLQDWLTRTLQGLAAAA